MNINNNDKNTLIPHQRPCPLILLQLKAKITYRILPNTHAGTPKNLEGCVYSGLIRSKSNNVGGLRGFPNLQFRF